ncbi:hypothetical protein [Bradyrhizobium yuanmingense]|uniref:hypothetical protein n=1 Tax=Bradyrhizobium yuanmingense TaxID=108015 RepID=UPI001FDA331B|nr:hypothetical protein [Bradyrhizobium yuanmingense]
MPSISGAFPNGAPVQRFWGVLKMYENQFDLMPLRCAIDETPRVDGLCPDVAMPASGATAGVKAPWCRQALASPIASMVSSDMSRAWHIGRMTSAYHRREQRRAARVQAGGAELRQSMAVVFSTDRRLGE